MRDIKVAINSSNNNPSVVLRLATLKRLGLGQTTVEQNQEPRSYDMAEGTRLSQLAEAVTTVQGETASLKGEQDRQGALIEGVLQQLTNLASSYDSLVQITAKLSAGEGTSNNVRVNANPLFDGHSGIQARTLQLNFSRFDSGDPYEWILKAQQFFAYCQTLEDQKLQIVSFHIEGKALSWHYWLTESNPVAS
ncbi:hypothetical protein F0562_006144 [Nyssa sinensis]|uniref:Retrotransposon gag domain-containing protein n=1 Tax=Nyssa sinensis TaxID=561372 RepID=A0A5J5AKC3_9ASTE|nr:hypothetical protein F0562_006144 [Nyssa sinensis]